MKNIYKRHRFPPSVIQYAVWLYYRFNLSVRDVEDLLAQRNISVSYEAIRLWVKKFGPKFARQLKRRHPDFWRHLFSGRGVHQNQRQTTLPLACSGSRWHAITGWRVVDVYLQERRDAKAAKRFFRRFLRAGGMPREIVTDKLRSYGVAHRALTPGARHNMQQYANNRAELSHQPTRVRERGMRKFKSMTQAQRFLESHSAVYNLFNLHGHSLSRRLFKVWRARSFETWNATTAS